MAETKQADEQEQEEKLQASAARVTEREASGDDAEEVEIAPPNLSWMQNTLQWGTRAKPTKNGLTIDALNIGVYGDVPDFWDDQTRKPRGAYPIPGVAPLGFEVREKRELWADNAADLYEEAIQRRWAPATDVPWNTIQTLPDDVEAAMCQLCTELSQYASIEIEVIGGWQQKLSYGFHEVKLLLATQMFDNARHFEAFRKRALSNGGGLGLENKGEVNRMLLESTGGWPETVVMLHMLRGTFIFMLYRYGELFAHNPAEKVLFARCLQDKARHLAYGLAHLRYATSHNPDKIIVFGRLMNIAERVFERELKDPVLREALAIIFGGGIEGAQSGMRQYERMMGDFARQYLANMEHIGVRREEGFPPALAKFMEA